MRWPRGLREAGLAVITALAVLSALGFSNSALIRGLEAASLDLRFRIRGARAPGGETTVILIDDRSLAALGRWPLSRRLFAKAVTALDHAGAKVIAFDLLFTEPEHPVPVDLRDTARAAAAELSQPRYKRLRAALQHLAENDPDAEFREAIRRSGRVLLPIAFAFTGPREVAPPDLSGWAYSAFDRSPVKPMFPLQPISVMLPTAGLARAADGVGHVNVAYDRDEAPRYDYLTLPFAGDFLPSITVRAAAAYLGIPWSDVGLALGRGVRIGRLMIPTDPAMRLLINYRGPPGTFPTYSFVDLIRGRVPEAALRNHIVLLGVSALGVNDGNPSPFGTALMPGTERLANSIDTILHRRFIAEVSPPWPAIVFSAVLLLALATGFAIAVLPTRFAAIAGGVPLLAWCIAIQLAFTHGLWLPAISPLMALAGAALATLLFRYQVVDYEDRQVKIAFRHYLAPAMVTVVAAHPERLRLGGETRPLTVMFCDVRGFTSIAEQFKSNPQGLTRLINRFLTPMTDVIMARKGTIDKYMGDCVMAFWNAPLDDAEHAANACNCALAMLAALADLNRQLQDEGGLSDGSYEPLRVGIGINTGECVVGNMGSDQRFDYSVLGDAVNLASRLEGQSKTYHVSIVISEDTRMAVPDLAALELDLIAVKGKHEAVRVYTLLGDASLAQSAEFEALSERHAAMLVGYRRQDWAGARAALAECRGRDPRLEALYDLYEERIAHYADNPPGPDWDGVFVAVTK
ncbi:MAG TPA: adenylate/guanylate cyclase domain-containing protein [Stellaceae bacterium]|nr:adenylate/guanylate cyclase domain-containing protein [Stellaceae bacterium]